MATVGMTSQAKIASPMESLPVTEAKSLSDQQSKPADAGVPNGEETNGQLQQKLQ